MDQNDQTERKKENEKRMKGERLGSASFRTEKQALLYICIIEMLEIRTTWTEYLSRWRLFI